MKKGDRNLFVFLVTFVIFSVSLWINYYFLIKHSSYLENEVVTAIHQKRIDEMQPSYDDQIPLCEELMQQPHSPFADGAFLTRKTTQVVWKMRRDGSRELTLPTTCRLKRYTAHEAGKCLKDKSLLYIGDSLTRYQYLSLTYFFEHKKWPMRFQAKRNNPCLHIDEYSNETCSKAEEPSVCAEGDWKGWPEFLQALGGGNDGGIYHGRMEAQYVRSPDVMANAMQYVASEVDGRIKATFVEEVGWNEDEEWKGWNFSGCAYNATCRYTQEKYDENMRKYEQNEFDWSYSNITSAFSEGTDFHSQYAYTNYVFYNRGLWGKIPIAKAHVMLVALNALTGGDENQSNRCFFRSTTGSERSRDSNLEKIEYGFVRDIAYDAGCEYFDIAHVTDEFSRMLFRFPKPPRSRLSYEYSSIFWDAVHYVPWVYEELNNLMLNMLCNSQK
ncbi:hypothetical protein CTEN210_09732 [Chaetoceros tenuissimus]|uniref:Uncharacterized protein n=1 Tax=Chaetoceros tenuissimus TaxID=426638 RepID=A0AAD3CY26_9STRA|nr:hypothetical protein CTEN210_09732 [Chaetoceros tenuissimus]